MKRTFQVSKATTAPPNLQGGGISASTLVTKDCGERCDGQTALQLLLLYGETGQTACCFAEGKLFVAKHCNKVAEVITKLSLVTQSFHFQTNTWVKRHMR